MEFIHDDADSLDYFLNRNRSKESPNLGNEAGNSRELDRLFRQLINKLRRFYNIGKASLALFESATDRLRVTHIYENGALRKGLTLNFGTHNSVMLQILKQGYPVADNYPEHITANIIEKRILLAPDTRSVLIIPLIAGGNRLGIINLASQQQAGFGLYLEGVGEGIIARFIDDLYSGLKNIRDRLRA